MLNNEFIPVSDDVKTELLSHEQSHITVIDESIPSPREIQTDETIILPEILSMTEYIRRHYENEIIRACKNQIYNLQLGVMYEGKLFQNVPGLGPVDYGEEELVVTDGPTPAEWGEPHELTFERNLYAADISATSLRRISRQSWTSSQIQKP